MSPPADFLRRYARHIVLPDIGEAGQEKLATAKVLAVGAGGLGASCLMSLAASGVGQIGIVEPDHVELSNLPRQTLYETADIGRKKAEAARDRLEEMNPDIRIDTHPGRLDEGNAEALIAGYDVVVDGTDNFASRYAINDACLRAKTPWVHAAMIGFTAHFSTFAPHLDVALPCYRCYVPEAPERERSCAQEGIISPLAGIAGSLQALETIKLLLGIGTPLIGTLLRFDALTSEFHRSSLKRDPACKHH
ncbi:MAG: HesA/MoeB/ThiF family protein [Alphaproteobacteria bacterium]|nr:HesA/MoeB/ThiF family protein [Alphaproteobacteria bacterium]